MTNPPLSQIAPLPQNLPFRVVSRTIGSGAYAFIRKAVPLTQSHPVLAVKFINKQHAFTQGRLTPKALLQEIALHRHLGVHKHIVEFFDSSETAAVASPLESYVWIAMELASNGDLFDKIEADVGVGEDIAHLYFTQLMSAVGYMHSKGVAHRDLKPENILVGGSGDLKVADFGLAALFKKGDQVRLCNTVCGSPPYIAPEIVNGKRTRKHDVLEQGYQPHVADVWSCGVILFTLLVGNTPWDEPTMKSYEFAEYKESGGKTGDELWLRLPPDVLSLLRGMMNLDPASRFTLDVVRTHPWMTRQNPMMGSGGRAKDPIALATQMMQSLKVDFQPGSTSQRHSQRSADHMEVDAQPNLAPPISATQPEMPMEGVAFDWELPQSQPLRSRAATQQISHNTVDQLMDDPALSQFTQQPTVPLTRTQAARKFGDIVPATALTQFFSALPPDLLIATVVEALHKLGIPSSPVESSEAVHIRIKAEDSRKQMMHGTAVIRQWNSEVFEVRFLKMKGDPLEWRRFFKNICALCKDAVIKPDQL